MTNIRTPHPTAPGLPADAIPPPGLTDGADVDWSDLAKLADVLPQTAARVEIQREQGLVRNGLQLYVSRQGDLVTDVGMGRARPGVAMSKSSIAKQYCTITPLTAVAIAQLVSNGRLVVDQPVAYFIPDFGRHGKDRITLRHLLTHTSGLPGTRAQGYPDPPDELLKLIYESRLLPGSAPGAQAAYSQLFGCRSSGASSRSSSVRRLPAMCASTSCSRWVSTIRGSAWRPRITTGCGLGWR